MLQVRDLETAYGRSQVLFGISFEIGTGEGWPLLRAFTMVWRSSPIGLQPWWGSG